MHFLQYSQISFHVTREIKHFWKFVPKLQIVSSLFLLHYLEWYPANVMASFFSMCIFTITSYIRWYFHTKIVIRFSQKLCDSAIAFFFIQSRNLEHCSSPTNIFVVVFPYELWPAFSFDQIFFYSNLGGLFFKSISNISQKIYEQKSFEFFSVFYTIIFRDLFAPNFR